MRRRARLRAVGAVVLVAVALAAGTASTAATGAMTIPGGPRRADTAAVIVRSRLGAHDAAALVRAAGGTVTVTLPVVDSAAARLPGPAVDRLRAHSRVVSVIPDARVRVAGEAASGGGVPSAHLGTVGADLAHKAGVRGQGMTVALIDTGVTAVPDLAGRLMAVRDPNDADGPTRPCVNFSGETTCDDSYGHGTFLAGLIAGSGAASGGKYRGVAPDARLVSIKIAGRDGSADVSKVLAAIQWVVSFGDEYGIDVLNLSLGTDSTAPWQVDPLNLAVQRAWDAGIVVVVAAGNRGPAARTVSKPGDDPLVITAGATDDRGTTTVDDDHLPHFSSRGPTPDGRAKPDVVAPGSRLISLRSPGSTIEQQVGGGVDATYRRGSGTSMSAAVVSGLAALLRQVRPSWTPDRVKYALVATAKPVASNDKNAVGGGSVYGPAAAFAPEGIANVGLARTRLGSSSLPYDLDPSRGTARVTGRACSWLERQLDPSCPVVNGAETANGSLFDAAEYQSEWTGSSWYASQWAGSSWYGSSWYGSSWYGSSWYGSSWYEETGSTSYGTPVAGSSWYGAWE